MPIPISSQLAPIDSKSEDIMSISSIGRVVHYVLSDSDAIEINRRRVAQPHAPGWPPGAQAHVGNMARAGDEVPALVVVVWSADMINGQAFLDGTDSLWITSRHEGQPGEPGTWHWPERNLDN